MKYYLALFVFLLIASISSAQELVKEGKPRSGYTLTMTKARNLRTSGKSEEAEKIYNEILEKNHRDVDALLERGLTRLRIKGKTKLALNDFKKITVLSPLYMDAHIGVATCLKRLGEKEAAVATLDHAHDLCKDNDKKAQYLADTAWAFGHWDYARQLDPKYKDMISSTEQQQSEYKKTLDEARRLRLDGFPDDAEVIYNELLERNPNDVDALAGLGFCKLRDRKRLDEALEDFLRVVTLSPRYVDAYIGAGICYKRADDRDALEAILNQCHEACIDSEPKLRYLASTAWREGYYPLARDIDDDYPPAKNRKLIKNPSTIRLTYAHSWLENQDDWDEARLSGSYRLRPDITLSGEYDHWWRYGTSDFNLGGSIAYRHDYRWSGKYSYEFSDIGGFLAEHRHSASLRYRLYKSLFIHGGPRAARYDGDWSRRGKIGLTSYWKNFYADATYSAGTDTRGENVSSYGVAVGYNYELRYALVAGYNKGEETIDIFRDNELLFQSDDVDSIFIRGSLNFTETFGVGIGGLEEYRNSDLFRRALSVSLYKSF